MIINIYLLLEVQSEEEDEDYRPHWELHWKVCFLKLKCNYIF